MPGNCAAEHRRGWSMAREEALGGAGAGCGARAHDVSMATRAAVGQWCGWQPGSTPTRSGARYIDPRARRTRPSFFSAWRSSRMMNRMAHE